jgi:hypothetical protein
MGADYIDITCSTDSGTRAVKLQVATLVHDAE